MPGELRNRVLVLMLFCHFMHVTGLKSSKEKIVAKALLVHESPAEGWAAHAQSG